MKKRTHPHPARKLWRGTDFIIEAARGDPMGFYHAVRIKHGGSDWVLCGPVAVFMPGQAAQPDLFGALQRGGR